MPLTFNAKFNGRELTALGLEHVGPPHELDFAGVDRDSYALPGRLGQARSKVSSGRAKMFNIRAAIAPGSDITLQQGIIDAALRWFDGLVELELGSATGRVFYGNIDTAPIRARWASEAFHKADAVFDLPFTVADGVGIGTELRSLGLSTTYTDVLNLGDAPSPPLVVMRGLQTNPTLSYAAPDETVLAQLVTSGTIAAGEWWEFDCENDRIIKGVDATGVRTDVTGTVYSAGSFPVYDRNDGSEFLPPLVKASAAALSYHRERWL